MGGKARSQTEPDNRTGDTDDTDDTDDTGRLFAQLGATRPKVTCELNDDNGYQLRFATILAAPSVDKRVKLVTPALLAQIPDRGSLAGADGGDVESLVRSTGSCRIGHNQ